MSVVIVTAGVEQLMQVVAVTDLRSAARGRRTFGVAGAPELSQRELFWTSDICIPKGQECWTDRGREKAAQRILGEGLKGSSISAERSGVEYLETERRNCCIRWLYFSIGYIAALILSSLPLLLPLPSWPENYGGLHTQIWILCPPSCRLVQLKYQMFFCQAAELCL